MSRIGGQEAPNSNPFQGKSVRANYKKLMQMQALNRGSYKSIISPNKYIELPKQVYLPMKNEGEIYPRENKVILADGNNVRNDISIQKLEDDIERDNLVLEKHFGTMSDQDIYKDIYSDLDPNPEGVISRKYKDILGESRSSRELNSVRKGLVLKMTGIEECRRNKYGECKYGECEELDYVNSPSNNSPQIMNKFSPKYLESDPLDMKNVPEFSGGEPKWKSQSLALGRTIKGILKLDNGEVMDTLGLSGNSPHSGSLDKWAPSDKYSTQYPHTHMNSVANSPQLSTIHIYPPHSPIPPIHNISEYVGSPKKEKVKLNIGPRREEYYMYGYSPSMYNRNRCLVDISKQISRDKFSYFKPKTAYLRDRKSVRSTQLSKDIFIRRDNHQENPGSKRIRKDAENLFPKHRMDLVRCVSNTKMLKNDFKQKIKVMLDAMPNERLTPELEDIKKLKFRYHDFK